MGTLLRDPTSSHLLEEIVARCPDSAYGILWQLYFKGNLARLGVHPVANFVASKAIERCSAEQLEDVASEMESAWIKNIRGLPLLLEPATSILLDSQVRQGPACFERLLIVQLP